MCETTVTALNWVCIRHGHGMCSHDVCLPATVRDFVVVASDGHQSSIINHGVHCNCERSPNPQNQLLIKPSGVSEMTRKCAGILTCWWISIRS